MRNILLFALISATLFACTPIENEPIVVTPVNQGPSITPDTVWQGYDYGFYYGKTYDVTVYASGEAPAEQSIVFYNDTTAEADDAFFYTEWSIDGVTLYLNYTDEVWEEDFVFYYFNELDKLICYKSDELTIVISKP